MATTNDGALGAALNWRLRPVTSAQIVWRHAPSGQLRITIVHAPLRGVTPQMLKWWFGNIHGTLRLGEAELSRYHAWHARDHIAHEVTRHSTTGDVGPGAQFHIVEEIGGRRIDTVVDVTRLDLGGVTLQRRLLGRPIFGIAHAFNPLEGATIVVTRIAVGFAGPRWLAGINRAGRTLAFPDHFARALCRHSVEEVGNFEHFLPALYATECRP